MADTKKIPKEHVIELQKAEAEFEKDPTLLDYSETLQEMRSMVNNGTRKAV